MNIEQLSMSVRQTIMITIICVLCKCSIDKALLIFYMSDKSKH